MTKSNNINNWNGNCELPRKLVLCVYAEFKRSWFWLAITPVAVAISRISLKNKFQSNTLTWACIGHTSTHMVSHTHTHTHTHACIGHTSLHIHKHTLGVFVNEGSELGHPCVAMRNDMIRIRLHRVMNHDW